MKADNRYNILDEFYFLIFILQLKQQTNKATDRGTGTPEGCCFLPRDFHMENDQTSANVSSKHSKNKKKKDNDKNRKKLI